MEQHLKERLTGAVVLATLAVILIPLILGGSPSLETPGDATRDSATAADGDRLQPFNSKIVPLGSTTRLGADSPRVDAGSHPLTTPELPAPRAPVVAAERPRAIPAPAPDKAAAAAPVAPAPAAAQGWLVQLGSFSNTRNAAILKQRLVKKSYRAFTRTRKTDKGEITRVFVGPSASRQQATQLAARLFAETHLKGLVIRQP